MWRGNGRNGAEWVQRSARSARCGGGARVRHTDLATREGSKRAVELCHGFGKERRPEDLALAGAAEGWLPIGAAWQHRVDGHGLPCAVLKKAQRDAALVDVVGRGKEVDEELRARGDERVGVREPAIVHLLVARKVAQAFGE